MESANASSFLSHESLAHYFVTLPLHPLFNTVHFLLTAFALRNEPGKNFFKKGKKLASYRLAGLLPFAGGVQFAQLHPVASCVMTFLVASSGGILSNFVLGRPPIECLLDLRVVATCMAAW